jgi:membrane associated rhomboid family serine protease
MIPLRDVIPTRTSPIATVALAAAQAVVTLAAWSVPALGGDSASRLDMTPLTWSWIGVACAMVIQSSGPVLVANVVGLWLFGGTVEDRLGHGRFVALWLAGGLVAALGQTAATPGSVAPLLGASGALAGIMGTHLLLYPRSRMLLATPIVIGIELIDVPTWAIAAVWISLQLVGSLSTPFRGLAAAMGSGLIVGTAAGFLLHRPERLRVDWWGR